MATHNGSAAAQLSQPHRCCEQARQLTSGRGYTARDDDREREYTAGYSYPDPDRPACALPSASPSGGFPQPTVATFCSALRREEKSPTISKAPDFFVIPVLVSFSTPLLCLLLPPPSLPPPASLHLARFCSSYDRNGSSSHRVINRKISTPGFRLGICLQVRTGQPLFIHPGNLHRSGRSLHLLASVPAPSVLLHVADRRCTSRASPFCWFVSRRDP